MTVNKIGYFISIKRVQYFINNKDYT